MKTNELLYELMDDIDDAHLQTLQLDECKDEISLKKQEDMTISKISAAMPTDNKRSFMKLKKKKIIILVAVLVMIIGVVACGRKNDWDIEFAQMIGLSSVMEELEGGYVKIGQEDTHDGITIIAVQAIGDQRNQWIQFDTNIPWTVGEEGFYVADQFECKFEHFWKSTNDYSSHWYSYNNGGNVSFILNANEEGKINRANVQVKIGEIYAYEKVGGEGTLISDKIWELDWKNYYTVNTIKKYPFVSIDDCVITSIEISPISIRVTAISEDSSKKQNIRIEKVILDDGSIIYGKSSGSSISNNTFYTIDAYLENQNKSIDLDNIKSIIINGKEISIK